MTPRKNLHGSRTLRTTNAQGFRRSNTPTRDITIRFFDETFEELRLRAVEEKTSINEQVRRLVDLGLETPIEPQEEGIMRHLPRETRMWLMLQIPEGGSLESLIRAIITDAYQEETAK